MNTHPLLLRLRAEGNCILGADLRAVAIVAPGLDTAEAHAIATLLASAPALYRAAAAVHDALLADGAETGDLRDVLNAALTEAFGG